VKRTKFYFNLLWKPIIIGVLVLVLTLLIVLSLQSTVPGGYSASEIAYHNTVRFGGLIPNNPLYLPIYLIHKIVLGVFGTNIVNLRVANGLISIGAVISIFFIIKSWFSFRVAAFTSVIYLTLTWFLVNTRNALPDVMVLYSAFIPLLIVWTQKTKKQKWALVVSALTISLLLYAPGIIWFLLVGILWKAKSIFYILKKSPIWNVVTALVVFLIVLTPFVLNIAEPEFIKAIFGINLTTLSPLNYLENISTFIVNIFWNSNYNNGINIGSQAVFDIFSLVLITAGVINIAKKWKKSRSKYILISVIMGLLLIGFGSTIASIIILPYVVLLIGCGLGWLLQQWLTVFPKNPFAQNIGVAILVLAIGMTSIYNVYRFYVAWPHMPSTEIKYNIEV
jgi:hypothetical protein